MEREIPIERKALYNLLRMQWLLDPNIEVKPWQVQDFRSLPLEELFDKLQEMELWLDKDRFLAYGDQVDTPEDLTDSLISDREDLEAEEGDLIYLLLFELWRRLLPEKQSLSIFCDELDHLILSYDQDELQDPGPLEDAVDNLITILRDGTDEGNDPLDVFDAVASRCANDLESFLYDYIQELIEKEQYQYANDLLDSLLDFVSDLRWFLLLKAELLFTEDTEAAIHLVRDLIGDTRGDRDPEFNLALLALLVGRIDDTPFFSLVKETIPLLEKRGQYEELLQTIKEFFTRQDRDKESQQIEALIEESAGDDPDAPLERDGPKLARLMALLELH